MEFDRLQPAWKLRKAAIEAEYVQNPSALTKRLSSDLRSKDMNCAADAAEAFGWLRIEAEIPFLIDLLGHPEEWLRDRASFALSRMPRSVIQILSEKVPQLEGAAFEHGVKAFVRMKQTAVFPLISLLLSKEIKAQEFAHKALCQIKFHLDELLPALQSNFDTIRHAAIDILAKSRNADAIPLLIKHAEKHKSDYSKIETAMVRLARHFSEEIVEQSSKPLPYLQLQALAKAQADIGWEHLVEQIENANGTELPPLLILLRNYPQKSILPIIEKYIHSQNFPVLLKLIEVMRHNRKLEFVSFLQELAQSNKAKVANMAQSTIAFYQKQGFKIQESKGNE